MLSWDDATVIVGGVSTIAIYSFLIRENSIYRFFEHLFIGIATGFVPVLTIQNFLWPRVISPLFGYDIIRYPDGSIVKPYQPLYMFYLVPILFGLLFYSVYFKRIRWLSRLVIGVTLGASAGMSFKGFYAEIIPQLLSSFKSVIVFNAGSFDVYASVSNTVFIVTLLSVMWYFFFTIRIENGSVSIVNSIGRWLMMVCFGAFFGSTVMARMALLVERISFMTIDWWRVVVANVWG